MDRLGSGTQRLWLEYQETGFLERKKLAVYTALGDIIANPVSAVHHCFQVAYTCRYQPIRSGSPLRLENALRYAPGEASPNRYGGTQLHWLRLGLDVWEDDWQLHLLVGCATLPDGGGKGCFARYATSVARLG